MKDRGNFSSVKSKISSLISPQNFAHSARVFHNFPLTGSDNWPGFVEQHNKCYCVFFL